MEKFNWIIIVALGVIAISQLIINFLNHKKYKIQDEYIEQQKRQISLKDNLLKNSASTIRMINFLHSLVVECNNNRAQIIEALNQEVNEIEAAHKNTVKSFDEIIAKKDILIQELQLNLPLLMEKDAEISNLRMYILQQQQTMELIIDERDKLKEEWANSSGDASEFDK